MILIVSAVFPPEPVVSATLSFDIACELAKRKKVTVISPKPTRPLNKVFNPEECKIYPFTHKILNSYSCPKSEIIGRIRESISFGIATSKYVAQHHKEIQVIYANTWPLFAQRILIKASLKFNIPIILHVQDIYPESLTAKLPKPLDIIIEKVLIPLDRYNLQNATKIVTISPQMKDYIQMKRDLLNSSVEVVRNWQDEYHFQLNNSFVYPNNKAFTFLYCGSISPSAGVELLISAFGNAVIQNSRLIIAGDGSSKESCKQLTKKFPNVTIEFLDAPREKVPEIQAQADILLLPLKKGVGKTASPSKLPAYMFSKKPIIASIDSDSDSASIINSAKCGWVIDPEYIEQLVNTMKMVAQLQAPELDIMGINGYNYALEHFSKSKNLKKICDIINETLPA